MYENKLLVCPYDKSHKLKESRMQLHIAKCKLNHLDKDKKVCPFNATHLLEIGEFDYHLKNCPDRSALDRQMAQTLDKNNPYKGRTAVPNFSSPHIDDEEESWDIDSSPVVVQIPSQPPPGAVIEPPPMSKPSERKRLYLSLHQNNNPEPLKKPPSIETEVLRQPKQKSQGETVQASAKSIESLGLGRGKPSRIAANIFESASSSSSDTNGPASYSNIVRDLANLGLARGRSPNQVPAASTFVNDDDFPALSCGRGVLRAPKQQSLRTPGVKIGK